MNDLILKPNKRRQRYSLEINDNAELIVKTPIRPSKKVIKKLIDENQTWIIKQKQRAEDTQKRLLDWNDDTAIFYRGKKSTIPKKAKCVSFRSRGTIQSQTKL